jgi:hypothetical protein
MKIQIDTTAKTIKLDEFVIMNDLIIELEKLFPNQEWKEYQLIHDYTFIPAPIIIKEYPIYPTYPNLPLQPYYPPLYPPLQPWITY